MFRILVCCGLVTILLWATNANRIVGQVVAAYYNSEGDFGYDIQSMPDLDQKRNGLDNDGCMYCVPTATMNLFGYAANFGYPGLLPGPGFWEGTSGHTTITNYLGVLGTTMETDGDDGTDFAPMVEGANSWIIGQELMISANARKSGSWPTIDDITELAVNGGIVAFCYGRYDWQLVAGRPFLTNRDGGHCVTLKLAFADNGQLEGPRLVHYRNPSTNDSDQNSNSNYSSTNASVSENLEIATSMLDGGTTIEYVVTALNAPTTGQYRIIDSYLALFPNGGAGFTGVQLNTAFVTGGLGFVQDQLPVPFGPPPGHTIISVIQHPLSMGTLALTVAPRSPVQLFETRHSGRFNHLIDLPEQTKGLVAGPGSTFFIILPDNILVSSYQSSGSAGLLKPVDFVTYSGAIWSTAAYDPDNETLEMIGSTNNGPVLLRKRVNDSSAPIELAIVGTGNADFMTSAIHDGKLFGILFDGRVVTLDLNSLDADDGTIGFSEITLPLVVSPIAIDFDSNGRMYVSDQQQGLLEFVEDMQGNWVFPKQSNFAGQFQPGSRFVAFKNQTNIKRGELNENEWNNILPKDLIPLGPDVPDQCP